MTRRERIAGVLARRPAAVPPLSVRLDLWYADAAARGALPAELAGLSAPEVEDRLGFARAARHRMNPRLAWSDVAQTVEKRGDTIRERYNFPERTLTRTRMQTADMRRHGVLPHITAYPLRDEDDYDLLLRHLEHARLEFDVEGFDRLDAATGEAGLPMLIAGSCPAHLLMLEFAGYERFFLHRFDFPDKVAAVIRTIEAVYRRDLWPAMEASQAVLLLHGNHFSSQMTPPPLFSQYFLPYFCEFNERMHARGKHVFWHADAEMGKLLNLVVEAGFDGADCLATAPLVPTTLRDCLAAWRGRIVCWGGLPGTLFDPSVPEPAFRRHVNRVLALMAGRADCIAGAADNVMPGAAWERLLYLAERGQPPGR